MNSGRLITSVYRKPTFSGVYTNYDSFNSTAYKSGLVYTLLYRSHRTCTDWRQIDIEFSKIRSFMLKNRYRSAMIDKTVSFFLNKLYSTQPSPSATENKVKNYQIILPYLGTFTKFVERKIKIKHGLKEHLPGTKFSFIYIASTRMRNLFSFKDSIPAYLRSGVVYQ